jgi:hypothetical protein
MQFSEDDWNDDVIMNIFHDSIKRHRTTNNGAAKPPTDKKDSQQTISQKNAIIEGAQSSPQKTKNQLKNKTNQVTTSEKSSQKRKRVTFEDPAETQGMKGSFQNLISEYAGSKTNAALNKTAEGSVTNSNQTNSSQQSQLPSSEIPSQSYPTTSSSSATTTTSSSIIPSTMVDEALQSMLMAWYHSGYATGRYQTLCELRDQQQHQEQNQQNLYGYYQNYAYYDPNSVDHQ